MTIGLVIAIGDCYLAIEIMIKVRIWYLDVGIWNLGLTLEIRERGLSFENYNFGLGIGVRACHHQIEGFFMHDYNHRLLYVLLQWTIFVCTFSVNNILCAIAIDIFFMH